MTVYQKAVEALKECVKNAMENDLDANTQGEIWRHYQGMKAIEKKVGRSSLSFKLDSVDNVMDYDPDYNIQAAGPVDLGLIGGQDVITFS
ncbi:hypothetical protein SBM1_00104 [Synechococcus phage S-BM1]|nr:hypothetical protein SBM1_00104 [Synechococcus phage S-BM1]